jgi:hypothetical protein
MKKELTVFFPRLSRLCEIAIVSGMSVDVYYDWTKYTNGFDDFKVIWDYFKDVHFCHPSDLTVTIEAPTNINVVGETYIDVFNRAKMVTLKSLELNSETTALRKIIINRAALSINKTMMLDKVSNIIACMDKSNVILPQHIAEAAQYVSQHEINEISVFSNLQTELLIDKIRMMDEEHIQRLSKYISEKL